MKEDFYISGIQQIGVGTVDFLQSWKWYADVFGMNIRILEDNTVAEFMLPYTGNEPQKRHACVTINLQGGGGFEIWQYADRKPKPMDFKPAVADFGIFCGKVKCKDVRKFHQKLSASSLAVSDLFLTPDKVDTFFLSDPFGNYFQILQNDDFYIKNNEFLTGGCVGAMVGVSDIEKAMTVYRDILGYDKIVYDETGIFDDFSFMSCGKEHYRRVLLTHSEKRKGAFSELFGQSSIELVTALDRQPRKLFENRFWGDPGFIQLCFDITNMKDLEKYCISKGFPFTVDSCKNPDLSFNMGEAAGQFTYIEDPDGTLIEFVETHKIPIIKKIGWYMHLRTRNREKPLPKWVLGMLRFARVKF